MCLISFSWQPGTPTPLTMTANRDEFHARPALPAQFWKEYPGLLAGQDLEAGGTWMGVTRQGRFAALTNVRQMPAPYQGSVSRGNLVKDYLLSTQDPESYLLGIHQKGLLYDGFNLVVGNREACWYLSNRIESGPKCLAPGLYGLSNAQLNTPWPKVEFAKSALQNWINEPQGDLAGLLSRRDTYPQYQLPDTGIGEPWETMLSAPFIISPQYGTRAGTGLLITHDLVEFKEITYDQQGNTASDASYKF